MSYYDAFLRLTLDIDNGIDVNYIGILLETLDNDLDGLRYFLIVITENLLTDYL